MQNDFTFETKKLSYDSPQVPQNEFLSFFFRRMDDVLDPILKWPINKENVKIQKKDM